MNAMTDDIARVLAAPETSDWLRAALRAALKRDLVEVANDAEQLARLLTARVEIPLFLEKWGPSSDHEPIFHAPSAPI